MERSYCASTRAAVTHIPLPIMVYSQRDAVKPHLPPAVLIRHTGLVRSLKKIPFLKKNSKRFPKRFTKAKTFPTDQDKTRSLLQGPCDALKCSRFKAPAMPFNVFALGTSPLHWRSESLPPPPPISLLLSLALLLPRLRARAVSLTLLLSRFLARSLLFVN